MMLIDLQSVEAVRLPQILFKYNLIRHDLNLLALPMAYLIARTLVFRMDSVKTFRKNERRTVSACFPAFLTDEYSA